jgi:hypothetical protein
MGDLCVAIRCSTIEPSLLPQVYVGKGQGQYLAADHQTKYWTNFPSMHWTTLTNPATRIYVTNKQISALCLPSYAASKLHESWTFVICATIKLQDLKFYYQNSNNAPSDLHTMLLWYQHGLIAAYVFSSKFSCGIQIVAGEII